MIEPASRSPDLTILPDLVPPHDAEAERAVLGAILVAADESLPVVVHVLSPEHFYIEGHRLLYAQCVALYDRGDGISVQTVQDALTEAGELAAIGGPQTLAFAVESGALVIPAFLPKYLEIITRHHARRLAIQACASALGALYGPDGRGAVAARPVREIAAELSDLLGHLADEADPDRLERGDEPLDVIAEHLLAELATSLPEFIEYPVARLNGILGGGSKAGELVYLGAGFGTGKTAIALEWATYAAQQGKRVLIVSAEMTKAALAGRILSQRGMVGAGAFRSGVLQPDEWERARAAAEALRGLPVTIDDQACTLGAIRRLVRRHQPHLVVIDYLQLLSGPATTEKRHEVNAISRGLKRLAKRHGCVVIALSQLTMIPDGKGKFQRPSAASLKESRGPSEDADTILLLWRPDPNERALELIVGKGRNHATGSVDLEFTSMYLWFREI